MTPVSLRSALRRLLPHPMVKFLAACEAYFRRLVAWIEVLRGVRGRQFSDRITILRSLARAPIDMFGEFERWIEPTLDADAEVEASGLGYFSIRHRTDDLAHVVPRRYESLFAAIRESATCGDTVVDAGANIGAVTVFMSRLVGDAGFVIAIEMMPDTAARLRKTVTLNNLGNVTLVEKALSDSAGQLVAATVKPGLHGQASIAKLERRGHAEVTVEVESTTIETILSGVGEIALLKLDLEGAEPIALKGAGRALKRIRAILFESWDSDGGKAAAMLRDSGYEVTAVDRRNFLARRSSAARA